MKRFVAVAVGGLGLGALLRRRLRQPSGPEEHAAELRERLAESRAAEAAATSQPDDVDGRRRDLHERTRRSIDELS